MTPILQMRVLRARSTQPGVAGGPGAVHRQEGGPGRGLPRRADRAGSRRPPDPRADRRHDRVGQDRSRGRDPRGAAAPGRARDRDRPERRPRQPAAALRPPGRRVVRALDRRGRRAARGQGREDGRRRGRRRLEEGPRRLGARRAGDRRSQEEPRGRHLHSGLERRSAAERARLARRARGRLRGPGRGAARRDPVDRHGPAHARGHRGRPAAIAVRGLPREPRRARLARGPGLQPRDADRRDRRSAVRQDRRAAARDRVPAQGAAEAAHRAQHAARLAVFRGLAQRRRSPSLRVPKVRSTRPPMPSCSSSSSARWWSSSS